MNTAPHKIANSKFTVWLLPQEPQRSALEEQIARLSAAEDVPSFSPHVTLYAGKLESESNTSRLVREAAERLGCITLRATEILSSSELTKSVYIQFEASAELAALTEWFRAQASHPSNYQLNPHLSLVYLDCGIEKKKQIARTQSLLQQEITFDAIQAFSMPEEFATPNSVTEFEEICRVELE